MLEQIGKRLPNSFIKNQGGFVKADMWGFPWGDRMLMEKAFLIFPDGSHKPMLLLPGVIFRPNRKLERDTKGASTHQVYYDAYEAFRGSSHAVHNYGTRSKERATEVGDLKTDVSAIREYVGFLLSLGPHFQHVLKDLKVGMADLAESYNWKTDDGKRLAQRQMWRGLMDKDSLGRNNPAAAAMSMGGAIGNLLQRNEAIQWLSMHMDQRSVQMGRLIEMHMDLYREIWDAGCKSSAQKALMSDPIPNFAETLIRLSRARDALELIQIRPFSKNAKHTTRDLNDVIRGLQEQWAEEGLRDVLIRLREGVRWVFVLDALQMEILFPLSHLIDRLLREKKRERRRTKERGPIVITRDMAPAEFQDLEERLDAFERRLGKCKDDALVHPVKAQVKGLLDQARTHIQEDDWRLVKTDLDAIAEIL